jgi:hypothetical protein
LIHKARQMHEIDVEYWLCHLGRGTRPPRRVRWACKKVVYPMTRGHTGNQDARCWEALACDAAIKVTLPRDYQYSARLPPSIATLKTNGYYDCPLTSRTFPVGARKGGISLPKDAANQLLPRFQKALPDLGLAAHHIGSSVGSRKQLERLPLEKSPDHFDFNSQILVRTIWSGFDKSEVASPTRYCTEDSFLKLRQCGLRVRLSRHGHRILSGQGASHVPAPPLDGRQGLRTGDRGRCGHPWKWERQPIIPTSRQGLFPEGWAT